MQAVHTPVKSLHAEQLAGQFRHVPPDVLKVADGQLQLEPLIEKVALHLLQAPEYGEQV